MARASTTTIRRIRVVGKERTPWAVRLGLGIPLALLIIAFVSWRLVGLPEEELVPRQRQLADFSFAWSCPNGHSFTGKGQLESRPCPTCGLPAVPVDVYRCTEHGDVKVEIHFDSASEDPQRPKAIQFRLPKGAWTDLSAGVRCPRCDKPMQRLADDPLSHRKHP
ncbi:MAG: hypothetical protein IT449_04295 [Phycisphaerales bacterium]|nr:hypothetical protein [Phycisphaerales bacterium]